MKPDFICIGAQKAGTQWLYDQVASHPDTWMPPIKEVKFFTPRFAKTVQVAEKRLGFAAAPKRKGKYSEDELAFYEAVVEAKERAPSISAYTSLFEPAEGRFTGDVSPQYARLEGDVVENIVRSLPGCRFVFLVREPVSRFWSAMNMSIRYEMTPAEDAKTVSGVERFLSRRSVSELSNQSAAYVLWKKHAGDRFRAFQMSSLIATPDRFRDSVFEHIGLDASRCDAQSNFNKKEGRPSIPMSDEVRRFLDDHFATERRRLTELLEHEDA